MELHRVKHSSLFHASIAYVHLPFLRMNAGYCFVEFENSTVADGVLRKLNGLPVPGTNPVSSKISIVFLEQAS